MKTWTYGEASTKLKGDGDLNDEIFVEPNDLIGYFNDGIEEAEGEILKLNEDYFLTSMPMPLVAGQSQYAYPANLYGFKTRGLIYSNGATIYEVARFKRRAKFGSIATAQAFGASDDYRWFHTNDSAGQARINLEPAARETAIVPPLPNAFTPMVLWYIRHANRVPLIGEYVPSWDTLASATGVNAATDQITVQNAYVTGDQVKLSSTGVMPGGLTKNTVYFVIAGAGVIQLATSLLNAKAGAALDITSPGTGVLSISIAGTTAIANNTLIDIPEFTRFVVQYAKVQCLNKDGDPRLGPAEAKLEVVRAQMVSTLSEAQPDDQNEVEQDHSAYTEMS